MGLFDFFKKLITPRKKKRTSRKTKKPAARLSRRNRSPAVRKIKKKAHKKIRNKPAKKRPRKVSKKAAKSRGAAHPKKTKKIKKPDLAGKSGEKEIGVITHYFDKIFVGIIKLKSPLALAQTIHIKGAHDDFTQAVSSMQYNHKDITYAERGLEIGVRVIKPVHENDRVYVVG
ncbi:MAG: hypothetical protein PHV55_07565 [Candidatus Omnitrophica bacterium]|nr:hypothetical protein [Candidatus Omnitrophota bacterium]